MSSITLSSAAPASTTTPPALAYTCRSTSPGAMPCAGERGHVALLHGAPLEPRGWFDGINKPAYWDGDPRPPHDPSHPRISRAKSRGQRRNAARADHVTRTTGATGQLRHRAGS